MFQNFFKISKFQSLLPCIKRLYYILCIKKSYSLEYNKIKECEKKNCDDLKFLSFFKMKH